MIVIIGAGISGLTCAKYLKDKGSEILVVEACEEVGGRVRTDVVDGFKLDRGFQVFLTSYPEAREVLDYDELHLQTLPSGARIRKGNAFFELPNPLKNPGKLPAALFSPIGGLFDKYQVLHLNLETRGIDDPAESPSRRTTLEFLKNYGFSEEMINRFFLPFFRGVFLDRELETNAALFKFLYGQFSKGDTAIPKKGMGAIPAQIASNLKRAEVRLNSKVRSIDGGVIVLESGEIIKANKIIVATDAFTASKLTGRELTAEFNETSCFYFESDSGIDTGVEPYLMINSNQGELIDHIFPASDAVPELAPAGKTLISVNIAGERHAHVDEILAELENWFGTNIKWRHLKTYNIKHALPKYSGQMTIDQKISDSLFVCGDFTAYPSLNGAMMSGRFAAEFAAG